ncbi:MAG: uracil-DNA glycosylase [Ardenticatenaceae bacterium]|nr:uracil-DNA glycosylase [Ardenticatenaceae bacterium]
MAALSRIEPLPQVMNPYAGDDVGALVRRRNLRLYGEWLAAERPSVLLLGEAVGYRGGRLTGVPFVSEQIMLTHPLFGAARGYVKTAEWPTICREATATIMWQTLDACGVYQALWNVFPFHPHRPGQMASNRQPTVAELAWGEDFVRMLLVLLPIETIVAVGNMAEMALQRWGLPCVKVRHPSHGGKRAFQAGVTKVLWGE